MKKLVYVVMVVITMLISSIIYLNRDPDSGKTFKIGVILDSPYDDKSWSQSHYDGAVAAAKGLNVELDVRDNVIQDETCVKVFQDMINNGCGLIIASSYNYGPYLRKVAQENPGVKFVHSGGDVFASNVSTCFGRIYQIRYLTGIVAGLQTKTNKIGYVAAFPIDEVNRGINAFTIGVHRVNPEAKVYVSWCHSWENNEAARKSAEKLVKEGIDVMTLHSNSVEPLKVAEDNNIWTIGYHYDNSNLFPKTHLTAAVWDWQRIYRPIFQRAVLGRLTSKHYWEGVETGVAKLSPLSDKIAEGTSRVIYKEQELMNSSKFDVFYGPIKDNKGKLRVKSGQNITDAVLLGGMNWYVEGVVNID